VACSKKTTAPPPPGPSTLVIVSVPSSVPVTLNGTATGKISPAQFTGLAPGQYRFGLSFVGYGDTTITRAVSASTTDTLSVSLQPAPGTPRFISRWKALSGYPVGLASGPSGSLYVSTTLPPALLMYSTGGALIGSASPPNVPGQAAAASNGDAYLFDFDDARSSSGGALEKYSSSGASLGSLPYALNIFSWPAGVPAIAANDTLLVLANSPRNAVVGQVHVLVHDTFATLWNAGRELTSIAVASDLHRCFAINCPYTCSDTVWVYTTTGQFVGTWRSGLTGTIAIAATPAGDVYLAGKGPTGINEVRRFTAAGAMVAKWGVDIGTISGMAVEPTGLLYLGDWYARCIVRYAP
jgi:PEGA domain-containing protein